jgi:hypothetical protein
VFLEESFFLLSSQFLLFFGLNSVVRVSSSHKVVMSHVGLVGVLEGGTLDYVSDDWLLDQENLLLFHMSNVVVLVGVTLVLDVHVVHNVAHGRAVVVVAIEVVAGQVNELVVVVEGHIHVHGLVLVDISTHGDVLLLTSDEVLLVASEKVGVLLEVVDEVVSAEGLLLVVS